MSKYENNGDYRQKNEKLSEPHFNAEDNMKYCFGLIAKIEVLEPSLEIFYTDCDSVTKIITKPMSINFSWRENGKLWTGFRTFHISYEQFKIELVDAVNFLLQKRFVKRKGIPVGSYRKKEVVTSFPSQPARSMKDLFGEHA